MKKSVIGILLVSMFVCSFSILFILLPKKEYSIAERRPLIELPNIYEQETINNHFMEEFENYVADHFPFRETFRELKSLFLFNVFNSKDKEGLYFAEGHISKMETEVNENMLEHASKIFNKVYDQEIKNKNNNVYFSIVPDKNYYLAKENGYLSMDYKKIVDIIIKKNNFAEYIDIFNVLNLEDYYCTDTHWKQENIIKVADYLNDKMGNNLQVDISYNEHIVETPFYGVLKGQLAYPFKADTIKYLTSPIIENSQVLYYGSGKAKRGEIYDFEALQGKDPYELFLSGVEPLIVIQNDNSTEEKELVLFRDSFGSSIAPLLINNYRKITIIDLRYINSDILGEYVNIQNSDVLFLYSVTILNNSLSLK